MRPILVSGHERALTQVKYNADGDLLFSVSKDHIICAWYSNNGERLGTYKGHVGALWTVCPDPTSTILASGGADNALKVWDIKTGKCLHSWDFPTAIKRAEFSEDGSMLLGVTEQRMGHLGTIRVFDIPPVNKDGEVAGDFPDEPRLTITLEKSKATVAGFSALNEFVVACHEDGTISQFDPQSGERLYTTSTPVHQEMITDIQWAPNRTYFITSSKDKSAKLIDAKTLEVMKTYVADTPLNSASITPVKDFVILGGGQAAMDVTTTAARQGKFEARIYHKIFEEEIGRVRGHFGPLNTVAVHPGGTGYCSGGEDGYVRIHHFDKCECPGSGHRRKNDPLTYEPAWFDFQYEVEREQSRM